MPIDFDMLIGRTKDRLVVRLDCAAVKGAMTKGELVFFPTPQLTRRLITDLQEVIRLMELDGDA